MLHLNQAEAITAAAHKDLVLLIKEYARKGYALTHDDTTGYFERLWWLAFNRVESETVNPGEGQYQQSPKPS